ncbi:hypothetical protein [Paratractidigestivibacter sp.]|uniref:hypothetical protein n=1 Tax=Paratractidigestivibacter sp. TaxID=2847316 RepID=UPI002ABD42B3|nr:hypothetical protein [Paratractidigestivibacter sp.]
MVRGRPTSDGIAKDCANVSALSADLKDAEDKRNIVIDVLRDWSITMMTIPKSSTATLNLNGHMLNGGDTTTEHRGTLYDNKTRTHHAASGTTQETDSYYWMYDGKGSTIMYGGLITGGVSDSSDSAGGIY